MKKKYLPKEDINYKVITGAYDKDGDWWCEEDIKSFTNGVIKMCFGIDKEKIKIIERNI